MKNEEKVRAVLIYISNEKISPRDGPFVTKAIEKLNTAFPEAVIHCTGPVLVEGIKPVVSVQNNQATRSSLAEHLANLGKEYKTENENFAICYGWYPLLDLSLSQELLSQHCRYLSHFGYSENIPTGFVPDFASSEFLSSLYHLSGPKPEDLRAFALKNINTYDVEIFYKDPDLRQYRLDFSTQSLRSQRLVEQCWQMRPNIKYEDLATYLQSEPQLLRPYPSYFELELSTQTPLNPFYWPKRPSKKQAQFMDMAAIEKLIQDIEQNGMLEDAVISLGGLGEPMEHPQFLKILESFLGSRCIKRVYLETFGLDFNQEMLRSISKIDMCDKLHIIIRLSTLQKQRYNELYGADFGHQVYENIKLLEELEEKDRPFKLYVEMLRIQQNDDEITSFFDRFEKSAFEVILQKYNRYIDQLPEHRVANLTPLHQDFCWHLTRDFYLTVDARVAICKQDPFASACPQPLFLRTFRNRNFTKNEKPS